MRVSVEVLLSHHGLIEGIAWSRPLRFVESFKDVVLVDLFDQLRGDLVPLVGLVKLILLDMLLWWIQDDSLNLRVLLNWFLDTVS